MLVEQVILKRTLRAGENEWKEGTIFPNERCPQIPLDILQEALQGRDTVKILKEGHQAEDNTVMFKPSFKRDQESTMTSLNVRTKPVNQPERLTRKPVTVNQSPETVIKESKPIFREEITAQTNKGIENSESIKPKKVGLVKETIK